MAVCFRSSHWIDHNNIIAHSIFAKLQVQAITLSLDTTAMQVEVNVATFFKALVWVENVSMPCETTVLLEPSEPPSIQKFMLIEFSIYTLGRPIVVFGRQSLNFSCWDVCQKVAQDLACGVKLTVARIKSLFAAICSSYHISWEINNKCVCKIFGLEQNVCSKVLIEISLTSL